MTLLKTLSFVKKIVVQIKALLSVLFKMVRKLSKDCMIVLKAVMLSKRLSIRKLVKLSFTAMN
ncbi:hypothetical protein D1872_324940 [compost metagenome]